MINSSAQQLLSTPVTLVEGQCYWRIDLVATNHARLTPVVFAAYTACPAVVVVAHGHGVRTRCPRDELFCCQDTLSGG